MPPTFLLDIDGLVEHLGRDPVAQGLVESLVVVEPEVGSQFSPGFAGAMEAPGAGISTGASVISEETGTKDPSPEGKGFYLAVNRGMLSAL